jgi:hypothetical protein
MPIDQTAALRAGNIIRCEGLLIRMLPGKETGATFTRRMLYYASDGKREVLLTVKRIYEDKGWVHPLEEDYLFSFDQCVGVEIVEL